MKKEMGDLKGEISQISGSIGDLKKVLSKQENALKNDRLKISEKYYKNNKIDERETIREGKKGKTAFDEFASIRKEEIYGEKRGVNREILLVSEILSELEKEGCKIPVDFAEIKNYKLIVGDIRSKDTVKKLEDIEKYYKSHKPQLVQYLRDKYCSTRDEYIRDKIREYFETCKVIYKPNEFALNVSKLISKIEDENVDLSGNFKDLKGLGEYYKIIDKYQDEKCNGEDGIIVNDINYYEKLRELEAKLGDIGTDNFVNLLNYEGIRDKLGIRNAIRRFLEHKRGYEVIGNEKEGELISRKDLVEWADVENKEELRNIMSIEETVRITEIIEWGVKDKEGTIVHKARVRISSLL